MRSAVVNALLLLWIAEISVKMSGASGTSGSSGKAKAAKTSHPTYASMIQQGLTALKVSYSCKESCMPSLMFGFQHVCFVLVAGRRVSRAHCI